MDHKTSATDTHRRVITTFSTLTEEPYVNIQKEVKITVEQPKPLPL